MKSFFISTGCLRLDNLLGGGFFSGDLIELYGTHSTGKSQLCMHTSLRTILHENNYEIGHINADGIKFHQMTKGTKVIYFDTSSSFSPKRVISMLSSQYSSYIKEYPDDMKKITNYILSSIVHIPVFDMFQLLNRLYEIKNQLSRHDKTLKLIIVDGFGIISFQVLEKYTMGHYLLVEVSRILKSLAIEHNIIVIVTNYTVALNKDGRDGVKPGDRKSVV